MRAIVSREDLSQFPEDIVKGMLADIVPGVMVVASMVATIAPLQAEGGYTSYTYIKV